MSGIRETLPDAKPDGLSEVIMSECKLTCFFFEHAPCNHLYSTMLDHIHCKQYRALVFNNRMN